MTILSDKEITQYCEKADAMIFPFIGTQVRERKSLTGEMQKVISYGLSSYGYDIRLSPLDFRIFHHVPGQVVDPKNFDPRFLTRGLPNAEKDENGCISFIIPGNSYALGVAVERLNMPPDVTAIALGKSTYARCGLIANITPAEAGWTGHLTLELSNSSDADIRVYANEGICQLLFFKGLPCEVSYATRSGKYQNQSEQVTLPKA